MNDPTNDFTELPDLASRLLGGGVVATNDEFYADADNLVNPRPAGFTVGTFGTKGQVYDGWETRRRREPGYDWAVLRLGVPGVLRGVVVDTAHFTGNYPPEASVQACAADGYPSPAELSEVDWHTVVPRAELRGDARNPFGIDLPYRFTHVRLCIHPDGGVARLRVHGQPVPNPRYLAGGLVDLAALEHGGSIVDCSNRFYGSPGNLLMPGLARVMGEGWETARRRDNGNDWVHLRLAARGIIRQVELDTSHFKGNAPGGAAVSGRDGQRGEWIPLLRRVRLQPDTRHRFLLPDGRPPNAGPVSEARLDIYPDGGMARLRLLGEVGPDELNTLARRWKELTPPA